MSPETHQNQPAAPAILPAVSPAGPQPVAAPVPAASAAPAAGQVGAATVAHAEQAVAQYGHDPYRLSDALTQLKMAHLARQYNIHPNGADR